MAKKPTATSPHPKQDYRQIFDAATDAIFIHDAETGAILDVNQAMLQLFGVTREEALHLSLAEGSQGTPPYSAVEARQWMDKALAEGPQTFEWLARKKDGELFWIDVILKSATISGQRRILAFVRDITQRKQAEKALQESELRYRKVVEQTGDYIFVLEVGPDGMPYIIDLNEAAEQAHGYSRAEMLGKPINFLDPFATPEFHQQRVADLRGGRMSLFTVQHRRKDGTFFDVEARTQVVQEGPKVLIVTTERDITDRKRAAETLSRTAREWQTTFDSTLDVVWLLDTEHRILRSNKIAQEVFHRPNEEIIGKHCWEILHNTSCQIPECPAKCVRTSLRRESISYQVGERWFVIHVDPILDPAGNLSGFVHIVSDITERKQAEDREKRQLEILMESERLASLGTLVAGVAHEIDNPNMFIMLNTPVLKDMLEDTLDQLAAHDPAAAELQTKTPSVQEVRQSAEKIFSNIVQGSERIKNIVMELKNYARETPGSLDEQVDINQTARAAVTLVWNRIKNTTDTFVADYAPALPRIRGNAQRIEQTLINLLTNACDATSTRASAIRLTTRHDPKSATVIIQISDEGCGMTPEILVRIRDPFFTTKRNAGGTGLGVSIISRIVAEHGGAMTYQSQPGHGTTVTVTLPAIA